MIKPTRLCTKQLVHSIEMDLPKDTHSRVIGFGEWSEHAVGVKIDFSKDARSGIVGFGHVVAIKIDLLEDVRSGFWGVAGACN